MTSTPSDLHVVCPPTYPPGCQVVFIGESPGADECAAGEGFVGEAGKVLQKIVSAAGLGWASVGRSNVVKRPPDGGYDSDAFKRTFYETVREGRKKVVRPTPELLEWYEVLRLEILDKKPNVVVACGNEALKALCATEGITKYRGSILLGSLAPQCKVVPIIHPSAIRRTAQWQELYIASEIIQRKVIPQLDSPVLAYHKWHEVLEPSIQEVVGFVRDMRGEFTLDIETRAQGIACVGLGWFDGTVDHAICVPIQTTRGPYFTVDEEHEWWRLLQGLMDQWPVVNHNIFYDIGWLAGYGIKPREVHDTMVLFHRYYPELPKSLGFVNMWFNDIPYYKDDGKTWGYTAPDQRLWSYNIKDVVATHRVWRELVHMGATTHKRQWETYEEYTRKCMPLAFEMQALGMEVDPEGVAIARETLTTELCKIRQRLSDLSDGKLAVLAGNKKVTDKQVIAYLYGDLKLPPKRHRKTKSMTADEDALVELLIQFPQLEVLKAINADRKFAKAINSYVDIKWSSENRRAYA